MRTDAPRRGGSRRGRGRRRGQAGDLQEELELGGVELLALFAEVLARQRVQLLAQERNLALRVGQLFLQGGVLFAQDLGFGLQRGGFHRTSR